MIHRTEKNLVGPLIRGLCSVVVVSSITLIMLPEAASMSRTQAPLSMTANREATRERGARIVSGVNKKGVWATPRRINVPVGRLKVPAIDLDVSFRLGIHDHIVALGPGLWPGTPLPGQPGNAVFAGHRTTYTHPFGDLDLLAEGDAIVTRINGGSRTVFRVTKTTVVPESEYAAYVLRQPSSRRPMVTLFACTPKGYRTHRIVVQAKAPVVRRSDNEEHGGESSNQRRFERS